MIHRPFIRSSLIINELVKCRRKKSGLASSLAEWALPGRYADGRHFCYCQPDKHRHGYPFRPADHTFGGSAAPLMPYLDFILFRKEDHPVMTLNIGGIANLHVASSDRRKMFGFDTGPGNVISNYMCRKLLGTDYDENGQVAAKGKTNEELLNFFMHHPFFGPSCSPLRMGRRLR